MSETEQTSPWAAAGLLPALSDPYMFYDVVRSPGPAFLGLLGLWAVTSYEAAAAILDDERCVVFNPRQWQSTSNADADVFRALDQEISSQLMYKGGAEHDAERRLWLRALMPGFRSRHGQAIVATSQRVADAGLRPGADVMREVAGAVPQQVILELLGVPPEEQATVVDWAEPIARLVDLFMTAEQAEVTTGALKSARGYFAEVAARRRVERSGDVISALLDAADETGASASDDDLGVFAVQMIGAFETTKSLIGNMVLSLAQHPEQFELVKADASLRSAAVEETLRYQAPVQLTSRLVTEDIEVAGVAVSDGSQVAVVLGAANRDPDAYPNPNQFDVTRAQRRHLAFGQGMHACVGSHIARMVAGAVLDRLANRDQLRIEEDEVAWQESFVVRCPKSLTLA